MGGRWPFQACGPGKKSAIDYLQEVLSLSQAAPPEERSLITELVARCMLHQTDHFEAGRRSGSTHCGCVISASKHARNGAWDPVMDELSHRG